MGLAIKNPVIVMALYDIGRDNWNSFTLSYNTYLFWMKNSLSMNAKFVIYTEDKFAEKIENLRKEFDPNLESTKIIVNPLEDLTCYKKYHNKLSEIMNSDEFKDEASWNNVPEMNEPLYNVIMFNKIDFIKHAKENNFFNGDLYVWADAGGLRDSINNYKNENWPSLNKINQLDNSKITFFSHNKIFNVKDNKKHCISQIRNIQGTAFFIPKVCVDEFHSEFHQTIEECISQKFIGSDEKILDITCCKNKSKYNLIKCNWRTYFNIFKDDGLDLFKSANKSNKVLIDLGSHELHGLNYLLDKTNADESWSIFLFEPNPLLNKEIELEENLKLFKKAAWIRNGRTILNQYEKDGKGQGSLLEETNEGRGYMDFFGECIVDCVDLHDFISKLNDKEIWLNVDIEYSEMTVIKHMIKKGWPKNIKNIRIKWHNLEKNKEEIAKLENIIKSKNTKIESRGA